MSLDKNLFTLTFTPHKDNPNILDLVDPVGTIHYRKQKVVGSTEYKIELYDPFSESLLATVTAPSAPSKTKTIELYNPTSNVEMKYTGGLSFKWSFKWEDHEFEWKREECFIVRKPDPPVIVAVTKDSGRLKPATLQLLDYNINRFDINDRKGLEIVILAVLLTFADANDAAHSADGNAGQSNVLSRNTSFAPSKPDAPPPPPPKPAPKTGVERIAEMQAVQGEYNEIIISDEGSVADYAAYCNKLLQDDAILFVSLKSAEAEQVPKVLQVVEETKRIRHKAGLDEQEGLHQYVLYDQKDQKKGPRVINLDDDDKKKYAPPKNLTVHLSKIAMPELQPPKSPGNNDKSQKGFDAVKEGKKAFQSLFSRPPAVAPTSRPPPATSASRPPPVATTSRPQSAGNTPRPQPAGTTSRPQPAGTTPRPQPPTGRPSSISSHPPPKAGQKLQRPSSKPNIPQNHMPPYQAHPNQPSVPPPHMPSPHLKNPPAYSFSPPKGNYDKHRPPGPPGPSNSFPPPPWATGKGPGQQAGLYPPGMPPSNTSPYPYASGPSNFPSGKKPPSPMPPPPPFSAVPTESSGGGSKPQGNAATIVQGASTVVQGFMGLIASGKLK